MELQNKQMKITAIRLKLPNSYGDLTLEVPCDIAMESQPIAVDQTRHVINAKYHLVIQSQSLERRGVFATNVNGRIRCQPAGTKFGFPEHTVRITIDLTGWAIAENSYDIHTVVSYVQIIVSNPAQADYLMYEIGYANMSVEELTLKCGEPNKE